MKEALAQEEAASALKNAVLASSMADAMYSWAQTDGILKGPGVKDWTPDVLAAEDAAAAGLLASYRNGDIDSEGDALDSACRLGVMACQLQLQDPEALAAGADGSWSEAGDYRAASETLDEAFSFFGVSDYLAGCSAIMAPESGRRSLDAGEADPDLVHGMLHAAFRLGYSLEMERSCPGEIRSRASAAGRLASEMFSRAAETGWISSAELKLDMEALAPAAALATAGAPVLRRLGSNNAAVFESCFWTGIAAGMRPDRQWMAVFLNGQAENAALCLAGMLTSGGMLTEKGRKLAAFILDEAEFLAQGAEDRDAGISDLCTAAFLCGVMIAASCRQAREARK